MKKLSMCVVLVMAVLNVSVYATTIIGNWENGSSNGWIDWGNGQSITNSVNASKYSFSTVGATSGSSSLEVTKTGWNQNLSIKLQNNGLVDKFMANNKFLIDVTVPADAFLNGTGGYAQIYNVSLNAQGYGWHDMFTTTPALNFYFWNGSPERTATLEFDYSAAKALMPAMPSWVEIIIATNSDSKRGVFYLDNARLVPEPATIAFLSLGLILFKKRNY
ncbi:MAG: hypothetical protein ABSE89_10550 [Sedimentisphaerales bacterium]